METKSVNAFVTEWMERSHGYLPIQNVAQDVLKCVNEYNFDLTWDQVDVLERVLGDLSGDYFRGERLNPKFFSVVGFIMTCGTANAGRLQDC